MILHGSITPTWNRQDYINLRFNNYPYHENQAIQLSYKEDYDIYKLEIGYYRTDDDFLEKTFNLSNEFNWLKNKSYALHKMRPGLVLPFHSDLYSKYSKYYNVPDINNIVRVIIFVEDWLPGHILQFVDYNVPVWKSGEFVIWSGSTKHLAANLGNHDRYTLQITGHY